MLIMGLTFAKESLIKDGAKILNDMTQDEMKTEIYSLYSIYSQFKYLVKFLVLLIL